MRFVTTVLFLALSAFGVSAQEASAPEGGETVVFDTSYRHSPTVSARNERAFLDELRWSAGLEARDLLRSAFEEKPALERWQELVAADGLKLGSVADALTAYWVLNWITANGRYGQKVDSRPVLLQLQEAFSVDPVFAQLNDQQKQIMAETYIRNFLIEHAALNAAVAAKDEEKLTLMAAASVARFRNDMSVDLLAIEPGPNGFDIRHDEK